MEKCGGFLLVTLFHSIIRFLIRGSSIRKVSLKFYVLYCCILMSMYFVVDFLTGHHSQDD